MSRRYFTDSIQGESAFIYGADAAHLAKVLRAKPGGRVTLCDGAGTDYMAEIVCVSSREVSLRLLSSQRCNTEPRLWAEMYIGLSKGDKMSWAVQKSVELGASVIQPFVCRNADVKVKPGAESQEKQCRLARVAAEAAKQCGRGIVPQVGAPLTFEEALMRAARCGAAFFFYEEGGAGVRRAVETFLKTPRSQDAPLSIALITGPEGGFTPKEAAAAVAGGCTAVSLGPRILRCETAPAAALAAVMALTGNLE